MDILLYALETDESAAAFEAAVAVQPERRAA